MEAEKPRHVPDGPQNGDSFDFSAYFIRIIVQKGHDLPENPLGPDLVRQGLSGKPRPDNVHST
jgi:hypothetical protein